VLTEVVAFVHDTSWKGRSPEIARRSGEQPWALD